MASVRFNLKRPKADTSAIECIISDGRKFRVRLSTRISVKPKHWSKKNRNVLSADHYSSSKNLFLYGNGKDKKGYGPMVLSIYLEAKAKGLLPDREYFYNELDPKPKDVTSFWELWETYLKSKSGIFKKNSFVKFNSLKTHLEAFEKDNKKSLSLENITNELMEDFQNFLYHKQNLNTQSTEKYISIFKMFLNWCLQRKYTTNADFKNFTAIRQPDSLKVIMTDDDIELLIKVDLGEKNYLKNVRSLFLLACDTGLRYGDFSRISKQHLKHNQDGYTLELRQNKTEDFVYIPLTDEALKTVRDMIEGKLHAITNQRMNLYVKELCKLAEINEPFEVHQYKGREKRIITVPKYELITTHCGRRTFATRLLENGVPAEIVMNFTGHKDYKSFSKYVNIPKRTEMKIVRQALEGNNMRVA